MRIVMATAARPWYNEGALPGIGEDSRRRATQKEDNIVSGNHPRITRERKTVEAMIDIYCQERHSTGNGLCQECKALRDYARQRLQRCPYQEGKTTCAKCPIHCYRPAMREQIRAVMRYAGPRMPYRHPLMALQHMVDGRRKEPIGAGEGESKAAKVAKKSGP
jgi:hypothetical protein